MPRVAVATVTLVLFCGLASAQGPTRLEFSFSNPGARSMGFGGAFVALADDATAAFANPAGLGQLVRREVSAEGRLWSYETSFTEGGRLLGSPTGIGLDTTDGLRFGNSSDDVAGLSFLSLVYPLDRWAFAFYRHQLSKFESSISTQGFFLDTPTGPDRWVDFRVETDLDFASYGGSVCYRVGDRFNLGLGVAYQISEMAFEIGDYRIDDSSGPAAMFDRNAYLQTSMIAVNKTTADSTDWTMLAGFLWHIDRRFSLGGTFRQGPAFDMDIEVRSGPAFHPAFPPGSLIGAEYGTPIALPDVYGLGLTFRSAGTSWTASFEWDRVEYSTIMESLDRAVFDDLPEVDDADELHAGVEYVLVASTPVVALRTGVWLDPDHRLRAKEGNTFERAFFQGGDDELHVAAGVGLAWRAFQLDVALDLSDPVDSAAISAIYKF